MNYSYVLSYQQTNFQAVSHGNFESNLTLLKEMGYGGVEIALRNPEQLEPSVLEAMLQKHRLNLVAIGTGQAYVDEGISLTDLNEAVRAEAMNRLMRHIDLASRFGAQVIIGLIRGRMIDASVRERQAGYLEDTVKQACAHAEKQGVTITIEPVNRYECNIFNSADEVVSFIHKIQSPALKVLLDTFHMNIEEASIAETINETKPHLSHVHVADSNRRHAGAGHIDFGGICRTLRSIGYAGYLSGEVLPYPDIATAMKKHIHHLKEALNEGILE